MTENQRKRLTPQVELAERFLVALDPKSKIHCFQLFHDSDKSRPASIKYGMIHELSDFFQKKQQEGYGVFYTVNETNGKGRKTENITRIRALYRDIDKPGAPELPHPPHINVQTSPGHFQDLILVNDIGVDECDQIQERLILDYGSDPGAKGVARVFRLPGFYHLKNPNTPHLVTILKMSKEPPLERDKVFQLYTPVKKQKKIFNSEFENQNIDEKKIKQALQDIDPDIDYDVWLRIGMALHHEFNGSSEGRQLWDIWSSLGSKYQSGECTRKYETFSTENSEDNEPVTIATIFKVAQEGQVQIDRERLEILLKASETDCGAPYTADTIELLARLKIKDSAEYMRFRQNLKKRNKDIKLTDLDKLVDKKVPCLSVEKSFSDPSQPSFHSISSSYPSLHPSLREKISSFDNTLIREKPNGTQALVPQSRAAYLIGNQLYNFYAYQTSSATWYRYEQTHWNEIKPIEFDEAVTAFLYVGTGSLGFSNSYENGVALLMAKRSMLPLPDQLRELIPFENGMLDLTTNNLLPTTPENALTWYLPYQYDQNARRPRFMEWILRVLDGDEGTVTLLQAFINAILTGRPDLQRFIHFIGPGGTGKSTLGRLIFSIVGDDNTTTTSLRQLESNRFETAGIHGKRLVLIEETDKYGKSVSVLKALTGQDPLRLERKHQQQCGNFIYQGQVLLIGNERLATNDYTSGIERRRVTVEFNRRFTAEERMEWEHRGGEEAILHAEIPGIIVWALELTREQVTEIFKVMPERVRQANLEAEIFNNPLTDWMLAHCTPDPEAKAKIGDSQQMTLSTGEKGFVDSDSRLFPNYTLWCQRSGRKSVSLRRFTSTLIDAADSFGTPLKKCRTSEGVHVSGLRLRREMEPVWYEMVVQSRQNISKVKSEMNDKVPKVKEMKDMKGQLNLWEKDKNNTLEHIKPVDDDHMEMSF